MDEENAVYNNMDSFGEQGVKERESAEPAGENSEGTQGAVSGDAERPKRQQGQRENADFAAARRKAEAERDAEIERIQKDAQEKIDRVRRQVEQEKVGDYLRREEQYSKAVEAHEKYAVGMQMQEISRMDPQIKNIGDLADMPGFDDFYNLVQKGLSLTQAYKLVNFDTLTKDALTAAKQTAINSFTAKEHLKQTDAKGKSTMSAPPEVAKQYRILMPDLSTEEINEHYARYMKNKKGR